MAVAVIYHTAGDIYHAGGDITVVVRIINSLEFRDDGYHTLLDPRREAGGQGNFLKLQRRWTNKQ